MTNKKPRKTAKERRAAMREKKAKEWLKSWLPEAIGVEVFPGPDLVLVFNLPGMKEAICCLPGNIDEMTKDGWDLSFDLIEDCRAWNRLYAGRPVPAWEGE